MITNPQITLCSSCPMATPLDPNTAVEFKPKQSVGPTTPDQPLLNSA
jgi:hypothetical protein